MIEEIKEGQCHYVRPVRLRLLPGSLPAFSPKTPPSAAMLSAGPSLHPYRDPFLSAVGCVAFAFILSDAAFGSLPARMYAAGEFTYEDIKVGDILRVRNDVPPSAAMLSAGPSLHPYRDPFPPGHPPGSLPAFLSIVNLHHAQPAAWQAAWPSML